MSERSSLGLLAAAVVVGGAVLLGGCDGGGGDGTGGTGAAGGAGAAGGSGGSGGGVGGTGGDGGGTTTIDACPLASEVHVVSTILKPDGTVLGDESVTFGGTVTGTGVDTPPTFDCGSGMAWVKVAQANTNDEWIACFQAPGLQWNVAMGDEAQVRQIADVHAIAPASLHTTLIVNNELVVHTELATVEAEVSLPNGIALERGTQVCASPDSPCQVAGYRAIATSGSASADLPPGETQVVGDYRMYLDRYWIEKVSSACDGGGAHIRLSVTKDFAE